MILVLYIALWGGVWLTKMSLNLPNSKITNKISEIYFYIKVRKFKDDIYCRQMKMRPGELLLDKLDSIEDTKVNTLKNLYSYKVVIFVCLYV